MSSAMICDSWSLRRRGETMVGFLHLFHDTVSRPLYFHWRQFSVNVNENEKRKKEMKTKKPVVYGRDRYFNIGKTIHAFLDPHQLFLVPMERRG